ncbi:C-Myc-binding protein, partial [uncultured Megasphaera sp.]|uniref:C-Myc-binding protein n=1 Tax=uncultured Megasphaera sp. TaxID=165188 RepID=UPI0025CF2BCE
MKITQIMYTNEAAGLSCRGEERFLPYGEALCLTGRAVPTARLWNKMQDDGTAEFPDQTGRMNGTCQLIQQSFTPRKAVYQLYRTDTVQQHIATITLEQFPRPTAIGGHKVRGHIAVTQPIQPSSIAETLSLAGALDTAGQIALGLGVIRLVYDDTPPVADDDAARLRDELAQSQAYYQTLQESYDGYVQTLEQSLREWETRCPQEDVEKRALPLPDDYTSRLEKALEGFRVCLAGGSDLWHDKARSRYPHWVILESK